MPRFHVPALLVLGLIAVAAPVAAQEQEPPVAPLTRGRIAPFVLDVRASLPRFKQDLTIAEALGVEATDLPIRGLGGVAGAHLYPLRTRSFALGIGAEIMRGRASRTVAAEDEEGEDGPVIKARWSHFSPQVSLNFGHRDGWSYVTVGRGKSKLTTELEEDPQEDPETSVPTLNYGGGARWFAKKHLAFNLDLRFYSINAQEAAAGRIATPKMRLMVFSGGISIR